jgi:hypothetical protein
MRFFNTAGPMVAARHYTVPPLSRIDLDDVLLLIEQQKYFVLHAHVRPVKPRYCWR